jgi:hypothetical protein
LFVSRNDELEHLVTHLVTKKVQILSFSDA